MAGNIQDRFLKDGVDSDQFLVGPAAILVQEADNFTAADPGDGTGFPRYLDDVVDVDTGHAMTANGWSYIGYTENINPSRSRTIVQHDSDQEARVEEVHDVWENGITVTAIETSMGNFVLFWQGKDGDPTAVAGAPTAQQKVDIGNPSTIHNRRVAVLHVDKNNYLWLLVYRKASLRPTGGPTFSRTGRVDYALEITAKPDTSVSDVDARIMRIFRTTSPVT